MEEEVKRRYIPSVFSIDVLKHRIGLKDNHTSCVTMNGTEKDEQIADGDV